VEDRYNGLKDIQKRGLQILLEVDALCKRNNITYFLEGGTLLGAVRHKGFIPWDDDVDIVMLREDYDKFVKISMDQLPERYFVQTNDSDKYFPFGFARIVDRKSKYLYDKNKYRTGFCLDIFPIDNAHDNKIIHGFNMFMIKAIQGLTKSKIALDISKYNGTITKMMVAVSALVGKLFTTRFLIKVQNRISLSCNRNNTKYKCCYSYPFSFLNRLFPSDVFGDVKMLEFEGHMLPAPKSWEKVLTILYGDYMTLPPVEERVPMHGYDKVVFLD
jgi:lipopolysaccharide cholinephosphotransferase